MGDVVGLEGRGGVNGRMGRPPVEYPRKTQIQLYVNEEEKEMLDDFAAGQGISRSAAMRLLLNNIDRLELGA